MLPLRIQGLEFPSLEIDADPSKISIALNRELVRLSKIGMEFLVQSGWPGPKEIDENHLLQLLAQGKMVPSFDFTVIPPVPVLLVDLDFNG